ncbi:MULTISPECIES: transposase [unclassified Caballeronia]|uniref:transposase n=1 Tax=unclassified Caballeronia TaxID=2646786 RepID=UPI002854B6FC|nr:MULTISPECIES: transposase [unclassified Caballeronia]MDR5775135.1 transposase [Caballeronia sp. LZ002]MDR5850573.1 transposase [Caballeronia sp. LZ003]
MATRKRRQFDTSYKVQMVKMIYEKGFSAGEVCRMTGLDKPTLRRWIVEYDAERAEKSNRNIPTPL